MAWLRDNGLAAREVAVVWHAGEPLTVPPDWYEDAFAAIAAETPSGTIVRHGMQTNGMLVNDEWCQFFARHSVAVGISLDGPARLHDARRRTRSGGPTHAAAMRGIATLRRHDIPFHVICVVGAESLDAADEIADFMIELGPTEVGFNIEELEGAHRQTSLSGVLPGRYRAFLARILDRAARSGRLVVREEEAVRLQLKNNDFGRAMSNDQNVPFAIVSVDREGGISTFSPELAGQKLPWGGRFTFGQLGETDLPQVLADTGFQRVWQEIAAGTSACARECPYMRLCGGGAPANKFAECGSFAATETLHCRFSQQQAIEAVLRHLERQFIATKIPR